MHDRTFRELASLFFTTRQIIRAKLSRRPDPNAWMRLETLRYIADSRGPTMQDVAQYLRVRAPSATSLIRNLAGRGLVMRRTPSADKRVVRLYITKRAQHMLTVYGRRSAATMRGVFMKLGEREVKDLARILQRLQDIHRSDM